MKNYYKVLEVRKDASPDEIKEAFESLAQKYDPNTNKGDKYAEEKFIDVSVAYKTLIDADKRKDYDRILKSLALDVSDITDEESVPDEKKRPKIRAIGFITIVLVLLATGFFIYENSLQTNKEIATEQSVTTGKDTVATEPADNIAPTDSAVNNVSSATGIDTVAVHNVAKGKENAIPPVIKSSKHKSATHVTNDKTGDIGKITKSVAQAPKTKVDNNDDTYTVGVSKDVVLRLQGTPTSIIRYSDKSEMWLYGNSTVSFKKGKLTSYDNADGNLLIGK